RHVERPEEADVGSGAEGLQVAMEPCLGDALDQRAMRDAGMLAECLPDHADVLAGRRTTGPRDRRVGGSGRPLERGRWRPERRRLAWGCDWARPFGGTVERTGKGASRAEGRTAAERRAGA